MAGSFEEVISGETDCCMPARRRAAVFSCPDSAASGKHSPRRILTLRGRTLLYALLLILLLPAQSCRSAQAHTDEHKDVLILHSYHPGLPWTDSVMAGMRSVLGGLTKNIHLHVEYLDTLRYTSYTYATHVLEAIFRYKLEGRKFDIVLVADNPALSFALKHRDRFFLDTPVVFCGINNFRPEMTAGHPGVTGVAEYPSYGETIETALKLHPQTTEVVVIGGLSTVTNRENRKMLQDVLAEAAFPARFTFWDDLPLEELTVRLEALPADRLVLVNGSITFRTGEILSYEEEMQKLRAASHRPIYSFWKFFLGEGIVGGKLVNGRDQGRIAAEMALRILDGAEADLIPVVSESNRFMFDYRELKRFSLSPRQLPAGSVVLHEPPPFYALSKQGLWTLVGILAGLIALLAGGAVLLLRAKAAVEREKERAGLLLSSTAEGIFGLDMDGICMFCNPAALRQLGYREERDLLGKPLHPLIHHTRADGAPHPEEECRIVEAMKGDVIVHGENEVLWRADGTGFPVEFWSHPILSGEKKIGTLVTFLDISERKRAQEQRELALQELNAFVYTVSHDLRTPLAAIIGFSDFLLEQRKETLDEYAWKGLEEIRKQGNRMSAMMEDLLTLAKVGRLPPPEEPVDSEAVLEEVLQELGTQAAAAGLSLRAETVPPLRLPETFLSQIFTNLIGNAIRYAGPQGGPIEIGGKRTDEKVRLFVRDYGPGIPEAERERIFEVFYRGTSGKKISGTGIGLAIVRKIANSYGGAVWIEETPGGGATVWVELAAA